jgi:hypothetical protein
MGVQIMTETVPNRPVENPLNGRVPNAQLVSITVKVPAPDGIRSSDVTADIPAQTALDHVIRAVSSWPVIAPWTISTSSTVAASTIVHGDARVALLTLSAVSLTEMFAFLVFAVVQGLRGKR